MATSPSAAQLGVKYVSSSILLWVRTDQPRETGTDYWKGPQSGIISVTPGLEEYRQIHLAEHNPGRWSVTDGVQTSIPVDRKIDGVAEVAFQSPIRALAPAGRTQTRLAYKDEINVFRRTLLYAGTGLLKELRTQTFLPGSRSSGTPRTSPTTTPTTSASTPPSPRLHRHRSMGRVLRQPPHREPVPPADTARLRDPRLRRHRRPHLRQERRHSRPTPALLISSVTSDAASTAAGWRQGR